MITAQQHYEIIFKEITRHVEDTETSMLSHWNAAAVYEKRHKFYLGLPATLISILLTLLLSTQFAKTGFEEKVGNVGMSYMIVFLSLIVSVLSSLVTFLNFNDLAIKHRTAAQNYHTLWRECLNWRTDFPDGSKIDQAVQMVQQYRKRLCDINRDSPQIPKWAWESVDEQRKEGSTTYDYLQEGKTHVKRID